MDKFDNGVMVLAGDFAGEVIEYKSGWYSVQADDGEIRKFRAKQLQLAEGGLALNMANKLKKAKEERYVAAVSPDGKSKSYNNGDIVARALEGLDYHAVYAIWAKISGEPVSVLEAKYERLNAGAKRMNAGNRIRGLVKNDLDAAAAFAVIAGCDPELLAA